MTIDDRIARQPGAIVRHLGKAGRALELHQVETSSPLRGNVSPIEDEDEADLTGTLMAIWIWARHEALSQKKRFEDNRAIAWDYALRSGAGDLAAAIQSGDYEAPFNCALLLRAAMADREVGTADERQLVARDAAAGLRQYFRARDSLVGRDFRDPGFLLWSLAEWARADSDARLLTAAGQYVLRHFGVEPPPPAMEEPAPTGPLFDFLCTTATRVCAVLATQGETPAVRDWLRERVSQSLPTQFVPRPRDEHPWNASMAWALGAASRVTRAPALLGAYFAVLDALKARDADGDRALARDRSGASETLPTWAWAVAVEAFPG
jgi:hypothetical protein